MKSIAEKGNEYEVEGIKISSLFFVNDIMYNKKDEISNKEEIKIDIKIVFGTRSR